MQTCSSLSKPVVRWHPELKLPGGRVLYNMVALGEEGRTVWFMLEFDRGHWRTNPAALRLEARRLAMREEWFGGDRERFCYHVRRKALEWLANGCATTQEAELRADLRRWQEQHGVRLSPHPQAAARWTAAEELQLLEEARSGASLTQLARAHGRTRQAIRGRLGRLGIRNAG